MHSLYTSYTLVSTAAGADRLAPRLHAFPGSTAGLFLSL